MRLLRSPLCCCGLLACIFLYAGQGKAEDYEPVVAGGFLLSPKLVLEQRYTDNVYATNSDRESDQITSVKPSLLVEKSYRDHQFVWETGAEAVRYWQNSDESVLNYKTALRGELVARRVLSLPLRVSYSSDHVDRYNDRGAVTREPTGFKMLKTEIGADWHPSRFSAGIYTGYNQARYDNGTSLAGAAVIHDDSDHDSIYVRGVARYTTKSDWTPFVSLQLTRHDYLRGTHDGTGYNGVQRDNRVLRGVAGAEFDDGEFWKGRAALGQDWRKYDDGGIEDITALSAEGNIEWRPFKKIKLALDFLRQSEEDSTIDNGLVATDVRFGIDYELQQDLFLNLDTEWENRDFETISRSDDLYSGEIGFSYILNSRLEAGASYLHRLRDSSQADSDFSENVFMVRLTGRL